MGTWGTPAAIFLGAENSPSTKALNFLSVRKEAISLMRLAKILILTIYIVGQSAMLCRKLSWYPTTQQLSTYYCWNFGWRDPPASYTEVSYCDLLESRTDLHLVSLLPQCVLGLFLKPASQIICPQWTRGWSDGNFRSLPGFGRVMIFSSFQCDQAEGSDWINVLNSQEVFLEEGGNIVIVIYLTFHTSTVHVGRI
jgi:hypothetical protein